MKEPFLEPILREMRIKRVLPTIRQYPNCRLLDIGCGWDYRLLKKVEPFIESGVGIDFKVQNSESPKIKTITMMIDSLSFEAESFDVVTLLAVTEHLAQPIRMVKDIRRILKNNGRLIITVPSKVAQPVLQFLSYSLKIVSIDEIKDHKKYYDRKELEKLFSQTGMKIERHCYFQLGMNNFCVVKKA